MTVGQVWWHNSLCDTEKISRLFLISMDSAPSSHNSHRMSAQELPDSQRNSFGRYSGFSPGGKGRKHSQELTRSTSRPEKQIFSPRKSLLSSQSPFSNDICFSKCHFKDGEPCSHLWPGACPLYFVERRSCNVIDGRPLAYSYTAGPPIPFSSTALEDLGSGSPGAGIRLYTVTR